jgi:hypothetical protein
MVVAEPFIEPQDYPAFQQMLRPSPPNSQDEWLRNLVEEHLPLLQAGHTVKQVTVKPDEFARYCRSARVSPSPDSLRAYAAAKHASTRY